MHSGKSFLFTLILSLVFVKNAVAQDTCIVVVNPTNLTFCAGDSALIQATASIFDINQYFNFNSNTLPPGWSSSNTPNFGTICGQNPSNSSYFWASTTNSSSPRITTTSFDVSCGGVIVFDMRYAVQGETPPCEGPDLANEGVSLQYSIDNGNTWNTIVYYSPGGFELPANPPSSIGVLPPGNITPYTSWSTFIVPIPSAAITTNTMFQWLQESSTSGSCCDNWGLDNIAISSSAPPCSSSSAVTINWDNGIIDTNSFWLTSATDSSVVALVYDSFGSLQCTSDTVKISIAPENFTFDLLDSAVVSCPTDSLLASISNLQNAFSPITYSWSNGSLSSDAYLGAELPNASSTYYYIDVINGCGDVVSDSIHLTKTPTLMIDTTIVSTISCAGGANGGISVTLSGGIPAYNYNWSNGSTTSNIQGLTSGTYTLIATDTNGCSINLSETLTEPSEIIATAVTTDEINGFDGAIDLDLNGGTPPYTFSWSNGQTTEDISNLSFGNYSCSITDDLGCTKTINLFVSSQVGLNESILSNATLSPNPTNGILHYDLGESFDKVHLSLYDLDGRVLRSWTEKNVQKGTINLNELPSGVYLLKINSSSNSSGAIHRILKMNE